MGTRLLDYQEKMFIAKVAENRRKMKSDLAASENDLAHMLTTSSSDDFNVKMVQLSVNFMKKNLAEGEVRHAAYVAKVKPPKQRKFK
jgi:hypothetical protein